MVSLAQNPVDAERFTARDKSAPAAELRTQFTGINSTTVACAPRNSPIFGDAFVTVRAQTVQPRESVNALAPFGGTPDAQDHGMETLLEIADTVMHQAKRKGKTEPSGGK